MTEATNEIGIERTMITVALHLPKKINTTAITTKKVIMIVSFNELIVSMIFVEPSMMILSLISKYGPDELRFVIIDPKQVDFVYYKELPHMLFDTIIDNDIPLVNSVLDWVVEEMDRRYIAFQALHVRDLPTYNNKITQNIVDLNG